MFWFLEKSFWNVPKISGYTQKFGTSANYVPQIKMPRLSCITKQPRPPPPYIYYPTLRTNFTSSTLHCKMYLLPCLLSLSPWITSLSKDIITSLRKQVLFIQNKYHKLRFWARWYVLCTICVKMVTMWQQCLLNMSIWNIFSYRLIKTLTSILS